MQFLSYPIGILIGLLPVAVSLGPTEAPAHLLLDGRPVCEMTMHSQSCMANLGPDPRVHLLELIRTDENGVVTDRISRWINRPGIEPEVFASGECVSHLRQCAFDLTWAHPAKLDPKRVQIELDGTAVWSGTSRHATISWNASLSPQVVVVKAQFSDGTGATYTRVLQSSYLEEAHASLRMIPVIADLPTPTGALLAALKEAGRPVTMVDEAEAEIVFVFEPGVFGSVRGAFRAPSSNEDSVVSLSPNAPGAPGRYLSPGHPHPVDGGGFGSVRVIAPDEFLSEYEGKLSRLADLQPAKRARFSRVADAVAAAGYAVGSVPKRRAAVLVLGGRETPSISTFSAEQVLAYLREIMVPLIVWRVGDVAAPQWPVGPRIETADDARSALAQLRAALDRQRVAWFDGLEDTRYLGARLTRGIRVAGREQVSVFETRARPSWEGMDERTTPIGPDGGPAHVIDATADGSVVYAGTEAGVFRSLDKGGRWKNASAGLPAVPVRCLVVDKRSQTTIYAGTDVGLYRSADGGDRWKAVKGPELPIASIVIDPTNPQVLYVGTAGLGVWRSEDGGATLTVTPLDHGDVRALAVNTCDGSLFGASEDGIFKRSASGWTLLLATRPIGRVLSLRSDGREPCRVLAGTAGEGLIASSDAGMTWKKGRLDKGFINEIRADSTHPDVLFAASLAGVLTSLDGGESWKLARVGAVESVAPVGGAYVFAATSKGVLRRAALDKQWQSANAGLTAEVVYSAAARNGSPNRLYVGTWCGLLGADAPGHKWAPVPGVPLDGSVYTVANVGGDGADLLVGTAGVVGRSYDGGARWDWTPTHSTFNLAVDPNHTDIVYASTRDAILKTEDGGRHWLTAGEGMGKAIPYQVVLDAETPTALYAVTAGSGVFRSSDGARTWKPSGDAIARMTARCIAVAAPAGDHLYVGTDSGVFVSLDGGRNWQLRSEGIPSGPVYALLADPRTPGTVFAGTAAGLFRTVDGAKTWSRFPAAGIPVPVLSFSLDRTGNTLIAGTLGAGAFLIALGEP